MGKTFQKVHASSVGDFGNETNKIPRWIVANGGTYSTEITNSVTHLISTREAYVQNDLAVVEAKWLKNVRIVSYDWLSESLLLNNRIPRKTTPYQWDAIFKDEKQKRQAEKAASKGQTKPTHQQERKAEGLVKVATAKEKRDKLKSIKRKKKRGPVKSKDPFDTKRRTPKAQATAANYRLYEAGGDLYSATLVRPTGSARNTNETIQLKIFETITSPRKYATHIRVTCTGPSKTDFLAPLGSSLKAAQTAFKTYFKTQTGKDWENRLDGTTPPPKTNENGNREPPHKGWYWFDSGSTAWGSWFQGESTQASAAETIESGDAPVLNPEAGGPEDGVSEGEEEYFAAGE
ncbi:hypothetical protein BJX70DRAFT_142715 [Aspergillus crustosus]